MTGLSQTPEYSLMEWPDQGHAPEYDPAILQPVNDCASGFFLDRDHTVDSVYIAKLVARSAHTPNSTMLFGDSNNGDHVIDCIEDLVTVVADVIGVVMSLIGLDDGDADAIGNAVAHSPAVADSADAILNAAGGTESDVDKFANVVVEIFKSVTVPGIIEIISHNIHWWTWLEIGITLVASITAMFLTDGASLALELGVLTVEVGMFIDDLNDAINTCSGVNLPTPAPTSPPPYCSDVGGGDYCADACGPIANNPMCTDQIVPLTPDYTTLCICLGCSGCQF